jgi:hypothetical protein
MNVAEKSKRKNGDSQTSFRAKEWRDCCLTWKKSSLSKAQFCKAQGLDVKKFYYWCRRFCPENNEAAPTHFVPIVSQEESMDKNTCISLVLLLPNQTQLTFQVAEERLVALVKELSDAAAVIR